MNHWIDTTTQFFSENPVWLWFTLIGLSFVSGYLLKFVLKLVSTRVRRYTQQTTSVWDDILIDLVDGLRRWVVIIWAIYLFTKPLRSSEFVEKLLLCLVVLASMYQVGVWGLYIIKNWRQIDLDKRIQQSPSSAAALGLLYTVVQAVFLVMILLIGLSHLGINISALVAGLGVGGIAVALAAQNILGDLLASLSIVFDKPFVVGDFIVAGSEKGTVEQIGIKTTRVRSISGEELIFSNKDLLESRVQNFKRMSQRRVVQKIGVIYSTPLATLEQIPIWIKELIERREKLRFERCHLSGLAASSLDFEAVFYVLDPDYNIYMDLQQEVLLEIMRKFAQEKIEFAFPTQTLYFQKSQNSNDAPEALA